MGRAGFVAVDLGMLAPGAPAGFSSVAAHDMAVEKGAMYLVLFAASLVELCAGVPAVEQMMKGSDRKPGEFSFGACMGVSGLCFVTAASRWPPRRTAQILSACLKRAVTQPRAWSSRR